MPIRTTCLQLLRAAPLLGLALATQAAAIPVTYTVQGTIDQYWGTDVLGLDGATLTVVVHLDTTDVPDSTSASATAAGSDFYPIVLDFLFTDRPGGAPDVALYLQSAAGLYLTNFHAPGPSEDNVFFDIWDVYDFEGTPIFVELAEVHLDDVFTGSGLPSLSTEWGPSDVVEVDWGFIDDPIQGDFSYQVLGGTASAEVPEPRMALLLGASAGALGLRRSLRRG
jgi:hypothetical protein